jgi:hypothetical protein
MLTPDLPILRGRYTLKRQVIVAADHEVWRAVDQNENDLLVKAWPYKGDRPDDVLRALWDVELRNLFRLASSPDAEGRLVVLRDASIDTVTRHLVLVTQAPGYATLEQLLHNRADHDWLRELDRTDVRSQLWRGLRRITLGLAQLHNQQMLHRAINAGAIFVDPNRGAETMRLSGFEFTVHVAGPRFGAQEPTSIPPRGGGLHRFGVASFAYDWFLFGALAARLLAKAEPRAGTPDAYQAVLEKVNSDTTLLDVERAVIQGMLLPQPGARLARGQRVLEGIDSVLQRIDQPARLSPDAHLGLVVSLGEGQPLTRAILEEDETILAADLERQRAFIEKDLQHEPSIVRVNDKSYFLLGHRLAYWLIEHAEDEQVQTGQWALGFCTGPAQPARCQEQAKLKQVPIKVLDRKSLRRYAASFRTKAVTWKPFLPRREEGALARERLQRFHEFFRVTNQIDLLFSDAQLFGYERLSYKKGPPEEVVIRACERERPPWRAASREESLMGFLSREYAEKRDGDLVYLGSEEALRIQIGENLLWKIVSFGQDTVTLRRTASHVVEPPLKGFLRGYGLFGQIALLDRRKQAIDKLKTHAYLLTALLMPDFFYIFTGDGELPQPIATNLDEAKQKAIKAIWETRPIFALQGPPGTGKTTLVANLLGQILADDPVAQVLVSAQAHAAVDVLRIKVSEETFAAVPEAKRPLSVRIPRTATKDRKSSKQDPDYPEAVAERMLEKTLAAIGEAEGGVRGRWRDAVRPVLDALRRGDTEEGAGDFVELVKRSANITYCTTTSGDLVKLAISTQNFDWSIIEEAGKAHGFDLVLPLQNGHRWLLIGDHKQLPPYRDYDFHKALANLDSVARALWDLPARGSGMVDKEFLQAWKDYDDGEKSDRLGMWKEWLNVFKRLHQICEEKIRSRPGLSAMLVHQHRMHPAIAELISRAYYADQGGIQSATVDDKGHPLPKVCHPFVLPNGITGKAILWLDVPWAKEGGTGEETSDGKYTSTEEVRSACSSPIQMVSLRRRWAAVNGSQGRKGRALHQHASPTPD